MSLRSIPSVDAVAQGLADIPSVISVELARQAVDDARKRLLGGEQADAHVIAADLAGSYRRRQPHRVINATGVLLHTNLGRAPLHPSAIDAAARAAAGYGNVEFDLAAGQRGGRGAHVNGLLVALTGAERAAVVNNNAAGLLLALAGLASGRQVPVSRGELIEIGGSYRLPELMAASGARMVEVGTTNRTRITDYERAITSDSALFLKVHPSNYRVVGFIEETSSEELVDLSRRTNVPLVYDVGSGLIDANTSWLSGPPPAWLADEPGIAQQIGAGVDLVLFSGDKLLGGPQAGLVVGRAELVDRLMAHPMARALRVPGPTLDALAATLELYLDGKAREIPFWHMASLTYDDLVARLDVIRDAGVPSIIEAGEALPGAGSVPGMTIPSPVLVVEGPADDLWHALLDGPTPVVARREAGRLLIDLRAVGHEDDPLVVAALKKGIAGCR